MSVWMDRRRRAGAAGDSLKWFAPPGREPIQIGGSLTQRTREGMLHTGGAFMMRPMGGITWLKCRKLYAMR